VISLPARSCAPPSRSSSTWTPGKIERRPGKSPYDAFTATFDLSFTASPAAPAAVPARLVFDLDLDVAGTGPATTVTEVRIRVRDVPGAEPFYLVTGWTPFHGQIGRTSSGTIWSNQIICN